jgi:tRNA pseudouridine38-40 synthase
MARYFLEMVYMGGPFSGFQIQPNGITVQSETEKALALIMRKPLPLTGSSRTDSGVHALQNYFHFDVEEELPSTFLYNINALLPSQIAVRSVREMPADAHCRFDAISREYAYHIHLEKDPFSHGRAWYYPYTLDHGSLTAAASILSEYEDFTSFSKRNTQVKTFNCRIQESSWSFGETELVYRVRANRFLRGMVRGLVGTMLLVGRGKLDESGLRAVIESKDCTKANFTTPGHGLFLVRVRYPWDED